MSLLNFSTSSKNKHELSPPFYLDLFYSDPVYDIPGDTPWHPDKGTFVPLYFLNIRLDPECPQDDTYKDDENIKFSTII